MAISTLNGALGIASSGLTVFSSRVNVAAHNIANVSTDGFLPVSAPLADGPEGKQVHVSAITRGGEPLTGDASQEPQAENRPSATDLAREMTSLTLDQRAFQANAVTIRTVDQMLGILLDGKV